MSDTPETEKAAFCGKFANSTELVVEAKVCRRLERQRDAYAETLRDIAKVGHDWERNYIRERHPELASGSGEGSQQ